MTQQAEHISGCPIVARSGAAGAVGGAVLAWPVLVVVAGLVLSPSEWATAVIPAAVIGSVLGAIIGLLSGVVLAVSEHDGPRTTRDRRRTAFVASAVPFVLLAFATLSAPPAVFLFCLGVAALSGFAGAALAPCVVHRPSAEVR